MAFAWPQKQELQAPNVTGVAENTHALQWGVAGALYFVSAEQAVEQAARLPKPIIF